MYYHLRRIGPPATSSKAVNHMRFSKPVSIIGRSLTDCDFILDSSNEKRRMYISRIHARVVRKNGNQLVIHVIHDDSRNGIFINNIKINGSVRLEEGDKVTFGHFNGEPLAPGTRCRQPTSEYQFIFERCNCSADHEHPTCKSPKSETMETEEVSMEVGMNVDTIVHRECTTVLDVNRNSSQSLHSFSCNTSRPTLPVHSHTTNDIVICNRPAVHTEMSMEGFHDSLINNNMATEPPTMVMNTNTDGCSGSIDLSKYPSMPLGLNSRDTVMLKLTSTSMPIGKTANDLSEQVEDADSVNNNVCCNHEVLEGSFISRNGRNRGIEMNSSEYDNTQHGQIQRDLTKPCSYGGNSGREDSGVGHDYSEEVADVGGADDTDKVPSRVTDEEINEKFRRKSNEYDLNTEKPEQLDTSGDRMISDVMEYNSRSPSNDSHEQTRDRADHLQFKDFERSSYDGSTGSEAFERSDCAAGTIKSRNISCAGSRTQENNYYRLHRVIESGSQEYSDQDGQYDSIVSTGSGRNSLSDISSIESEVSSDNLEPSFHDLDIEELSNNEENSMYRIDGDINVDDRDINDGPRLDSRENVTVKNLLVTEEQSNVLGAAHEMDKDISNHDECTHVEVEDSIESENKPQKETENTVIEEHDARSLLLEEIQLVGRDNKKSDNEQITEIHKGIQSVGSDHEKSENEQSMECEIHEEIESVNKNHEKSNHEQVMEHSLHEILEGVVCDHENAEFDRTCNAMQAEESDSVNLVKEPCNAMQAEESDSVNLVKEPCNAMLAEESDSVNLVKEPCNAMQAEESDSVNLVKEPCNAMQAEESDSVNLVKEPCNAMQAEESDSVNLVKEPCNAMLAEESDSVNLVKEPCNAMQAEESDSVNLVKEPCNAMQAKESDSVNLVKEPCNAMQAEESDSVKEPEVNSIHVNIQTVVSSMKCDEVGFKNHIDAPEDDSKDCDEELEVDFKDHYVESEICSMGQDGEHDHDEQPEVNSKDHNNELEISSKHHDEDSEVGSKDHDKEPVVCFEDHDEDSKVDSKDHFVEPEVGSMDQDEGPKVGSMDQDEGPRVGCMDQDEGHRVGLMDQDEGPRVGSMDQDEGPKVGSMDQDEGPRVGSMDQDEGPKVGSMDQDEGPRVGSMDQHEGPKVGSMDQDEGPRVGSIYQDEGPRVGSMDQDEGPTVGSMDQDEEPEVNSKDNDESHEVGFKDNDHEPEVGSRNHNKAPEVGFMDLDKELKVDNLIHNEQTDVDDKVYTEQTNVDNEVHTEHIDFDKVYTEQKDVDEVETEVNNEVHTEQTDVDNAVHTELTNVNDEVHNEQTDVDDEVHTEQTNVGNEVHTELTDVDIEVHYQQTKDNAVHTELTNVDDEVHNELTAVNDEVHKEQTKDKNVVHTEQKDVDNEVHTELADVDEVQMEVYNEVHTEQAVVDNEVHTELTDVDDEVHKQQTEVVNVVHTNLIDVDEVQTEVDNEVHTEQTDVDNEVKIEVDNEVHTELTDVGNEVHTKQTDDDDEVHDQQTDVDNMVHTEHVNNRVNTALTDVDNVVYNKLADDDNEVEDEVHAEQTEVDYAVHTELTDVDEVQTEVDNEVHTEQTDVDNEVHTELTNVGNEVHTELTDFDDEVHNQQTDDENQVHTDQTDDELYYLVLENCQAKSVGSGHPQMETDGQQDFIDMDEIRQWEDGQYKTSQGTDKSSSCVEDGQYRTPEGTDNSSSCLEGQYRTPEGTDNSSSFHLYLEEDSDKSSQKSELSQCCHPCPQKSELSQCCHPCPREDVKTSQDIDTRGSIISCTEGDKSHSNEHTMDGKEDNISVIMGVSSSEDNDSTGVQQRDTSDEDNICDETEQYHLEAEIELYNDAEGREFSEDAIDSFDHGNSMCPFKESENSSSTQGDSATLVTREMTQSDETCGKSETILITGETTQVGSSSAEFEKSGDGSTTMLVPGEATQSDETGAESQTTFVTGETTQADSSHMQSDETGGESTKMLLPRKTTQSDGESETILITGETTEADTSQTQSDETGDESMTMFVPRDSTQSEETHGKSETILITGETTEADTSQTQSDETGDESTTTDDTRETLHADLTQTQSDCTFGSSGDDMLSQVVSDATLANSGDNIDSSQSLSCAETECSDEGTGKPSSPDIIHHYQSEGMSSSPVEHLNLSVLSNSQTCTTSVELLNASETNTDQDGGATRLGTHKTNTDQDVGATRLGTNEANTDQDVGATRLGTNETNTDQVVGATRHGTNETNTDQDVGELKETSNVGSQNKETCTKPLADFQSFNNGLWLIEKHSGFFNENSSTDNQFITEFNDVTMETKSEQQKCQSVEENFVESFKNEERGSNDPVNVRPRVLSLPLSPPMEAGNVQHNSKETPVLSLPLPPPKNAGNVQCDSKEREKDEIKYMVHEFFRIKDKVDKFKRDKAVPAKLDKAMTVAEDCLECSDKEIVDLNIDTVPVSNSIIDIWPEQNSHIVTESEQNSDIVIEPEQNSDIFTEPEQNSDIVIESEQNSDIVTEPEQNSDIVTELEQNPDIITEPEQNSDIGTEPEQNSDIVTEPEQNSDIVIEPELNSDIVTEPEQNSDIVIESEQNSDIVTEPKQNSEIVRELEQNPDIITEPEQNSDIGTEPEQNSDIVTEPEQNSDIITEPEQNSDIVTEPEQTSDIVTEQEQNSDIVAEPEQTSDIVTEPEQNFDIVTEPEQTSDIVTEQEQNSDIVAEPEQTSDIVTEPEQNFDIVTEPEQITDVVTEPVQNPDIVTEPEQNSDIVTEPEQNPDIVAEPEQITDVVAEPEQNSGINTEAIHNLDNKQEKFMKDDMDLCATRKRKRDCFCDETENVKKRKTVIAVEEMVMGFFRMKSLISQHKPLSPRLLKKRKVQKYVTNFFDNSISNLSLFSINNLETSSLIKELSRCYQVRKNMESHEVGKDKDVKHWAGNEVLDVSNEIDDRRVCLGSYIGEDTDVGQESDKGQVTEVCQGSKFGEVIEVSQGSNNGEVMEVSQGSNEEVTEVSQGSSVGEVIEVSQGSSVGEVIEVSQRSDVGEVTEVGQISIVGEIIENSQGSNVGEVAEVSQESDVGEVTEVSQESNIEEVIEVGQISIVGEIIENSQGSNVGEVAEVSQESDVGEVTEVSQESKVRVVEEVSQGLIVEEAKYVRQESEEKNVLEVSQRSDFGEFTDDIEVAQGMEVAKDAKKLEETELDIDTKTGFIFLETEKIVQTGSSLEDSTLISDGSQEDRHTQYEEVIIGPQYFLCSESPTQNETNTIEDDNRLTIDNPPGVDAPKDFGSSGSNVSSVCASLYRSDSTETGPPRSQAETGPPRSQDALTSGLSGNNQGSEEHLFDDCTAESNGALSGKQSEESQSVLDNYCVQTNNENDLSGDCLANDADSTNSDFTGECLNNVADSDSNYNDKTITNSGSSVKYMAEDISCIKKSENNEDVQLTSSVLDNLGDEMLKTRQLDPADDIEDDNSGLSDDVKASRIMKFSFKDSDSTDPSLSDIEQCRNRSEPKTPDQHHKTTFTLPDIEISSDGSLLYQGSNERSNEPKVMFIDYGDLSGEESDSLPEVQFLRESPAKHPKIKKEDIRSNDSGLASDKSEDVIKFTPSDQNKEHTDDSTMVKPVQNNNDNVSDDNEIHVGQDEQNIAQCEIDSRESCTSKKKFKPKDTSERKKLFRKKKGDLSPSKTQVHSESESDDEISKSSKPKPKQNSPDEKKLDGSNRNSFSPSMLRLRKRNLTTIQGRESNDDRMMTKSPGNVETNDTTYSQGDRTNSPARRMLRKRKTNMSYTDKTPEKFDTNSLSESELTPGKARESRLKEFSQLGLKQKRGTRQLKQVKSDVDWDDLIEVLTDEDSDDVGEPVNAIREMIKTEDKSNDKDDDPRGQSYSLQSDTSSTQIEGSYNNLEEADNNHGSQERNIAIATQNSISDVDNIQSEESMDAVLETIKKSCNQTEKTVRPENQIESRVQELHSNRNSKSCISDSHHRNIAHQNKESGVEDSVTEDEGSFALRLPQLDANARTDDNVIQEKSNSSNCNNVKQSVIDSCIFEDSEDFEEVGSITDIVNLLENETICYSDLNHELSDEIVDEIADEPEFSSSCPVMRDSLSPLVPHCDGSNDMDRPLGIGREGDTEMSMDIEAVEGTESANKCTDMDSAETLVSLQWSDSNSNDVEVKRQDAAKTTDKHGNETLDNISIQQNSTNILSGSNTNPYHSPHSFQKETLVNITKPSCVTDIVTSSSAGTQSSILGYVWCGGDASTPTVSTPVVSYTQNAVEAGRFVTSTPIENEATSLKRLKELERMLAEKSLQQRTMVSCSGYNSPSQVSLGDSTVLYPMENNLTSNESQGDPMITQAGGSEETDTHDPTSGVGSLYQYTDHHQAASVNSVITEDHSSLEDEDENLLLCEQNEQGTSAYTDVAEHTMPQMSTVSNSICPSPRTSCTRTPSTSYIKSEVVSPDEVISKDKAMSLLEKLKARKRKLELSQPERVKKPKTNMESNENSTHGNTQNHTQQLKECEQLIDTLLTSLSKEKGVRNHRRFEEWKKELHELQSRLCIPKVTVAVVGSTGAGKSSLMNAIIDHYNLLPTSGTQACTAVVVRIENNDRNDQYEAEIEFLSKQEWDQEMKLLKRDVTSKHGRLKVNLDPETDGGVALLKMKAVYGKFNTLDELSRITTVTQYLGKHEIVTASMPTEFRNKINKFIGNIGSETEGGQYWPIIKTVTIRIPHCDVCSSGCTLVDLPGVMDSNAARNQIAKEYLKKCSVILIVTDVQRAISSKTAKELLGENFRRQLLMDGNYGNVAFICTKNDEVQPSELISELKLQPSTDPLERDVKSMMARKDKLKVSRRQLQEEVAKLETEVKSLNHNMNELQRVIGEIENMSSLIENEDEEGLNDLKSDMEMKNTKVSLKRGNLQSKRHQLEAMTNQIYELETEIRSKRREIKMVCAKARTSYTKTEIKKDYKNGIKEMKRKANLTQDQIDEYEEDDYDSDEDDAELMKSCDRLNVFCVSSSEYQKLKEKQITDGLSMVFDTLDDTEIPAVRQFIQQVSDNHRQDATRRLIQNLSVLIYSIQNYLTESGLTSKDDRLTVQSTVEDFSTQLMNELSPLIDKLKNDVLNEVDKKISSRLNRGTEVAVCSAVGTATKWGAPVNKGGLLYPTYRAAVNHHGEYSSKTRETKIDFNEDLARPISDSISMVWRRFFSDDLWSILERCRRLILCAVKKYLESLSQKLLAANVLKSTLDTTKASFVQTVANKLVEMMQSLRKFVQEEQKNISRVFSPIVKEHLDPAYAECIKDSGSGVFNRMKHKLESAVDKQRHHMFGSASSKLLSDLELLIEKIVEKVRVVCENLCECLQAAFEPLWTTTEASKQMRISLFETVTEAALNVNNLGVSAGVQMSRETPGIDRVTSPETLHCDTNQTSAYLSVTGSPHCSNGTIVSTIPLGRPVSHTTSIDSFGHCMPRTSSDVTVSPHSSCISPRNILNNPTATASSSDSGVASRQTILHTSATANQPMLNLQRVQAHGSALTPNQTVQAHVPTVTPVYQTPPVVLGNEQHKPCGNATNQALIAGKALPQASSAPVNQNVPNFSPYYMILNGNSNQPILIPVNPGMQQNLVNQPNLNTVILARPLQSSISVPHMTGHVGSQHRNQINYSEASAPVHLRTVTAAPTTVVAVHQTRATTLPSTGVAVHQTRATTLPTTVVAVHQTRATTFPSTGVAVHQTRATTLPSTGVAVHQTRATTLPTTVVAVHQTRATTFPSTGIAVHQTRATTLPSTGVAVHQTRATTLPFTGVAVHQIRATTLPFTGVAVHQTRATTLPSTGIALHQTRATTLPFTGVAVHQTRATTLPSTGVALHQTRATTLPSTGVAVHQTRATTLTSTSVAVHLTRATTLTSTSVALHQTRATTLPSTGVAVHQTRATTLPSTGVAVHQTRATTLPSTGVAVHQTRATTLPSTDVALTTSQQCPRSVVPLDQYVKGPVTSQNQRQGVGHPIHVSTVGKENVGSSLPLKSMLSGKVVSTFDNRTQQDLRNNIWCLGKRKSPADPSPLNSNIETTAVILDPPTTVKQEPEDPRHKRRRIRNEKHDCITISDSESD